VSPVEEVSPDAGACLEDHRRFPLREEMSSGGETNRTGADDGDRKIQAREVR
jgi:hypothetical protein